MSVKYRPGSVIPGVGVVGENGNGMPWPSDVAGVMYMGTARVLGKLYDAQSGAELSYAEYVPRRSNMTYNYDGLYAADSDSLQFYKTAFIRSLLATAMDIWVTVHRPASGLPDQKTWDKLPRAEREAYMELAYRKLGVERATIPPRELGFLRSLSDPPVLVSSGEMAQREQVKQLAAKGKKLKEATDA